MDRRDWDRIKDVFHRTVRLDPAERADFLEKELGSTPALRTEVETLLDHHAEAGEFLEVPVLDLAASLIPKASESSGRTVGAYRLIQEIGRGGMGTVYLAERSDEQFEHRTAIKIARRGLDAGEVEARFYAERRILARLQHPGIARLFDGGVTDDGRPYFVMEHVDGIPITEYCRAQELGVPERIGLFRQVCAAVHYAHGNLVLHRDLKPSNILVRPDGVVKLLDFGVAKLLSADSTESVGSRTPPGPSFLTPAYASPEQASNQPLTTASDVYSLGLLLYELLAGRRAYDLADVPPEEAFRIVRSEDPPLPSEAVAPGDTHGKQGPTRKRIQGDLDAIVMKALMKEPERRYGSAEQLSDDLGRHLEGLPVRALGAGWTYRAGKFARRHAGGVIGTAAIILILVGAVIAMSVQSVRIARERDKAEEIANLLANIFQGAEPGQIRGDTVTARSLLDRGVERVQTELASDPRVQADLLDVIGRAYQRLGLYTDAEPVLLTAVDLRRSEPSNPLELAQSLDNLGNLRNVTGDLMGADSLLTEALRVRRARLRPPDRDLAQTLNNLGQLRLRQGMFDEAEELLGQAEGMLRLLADVPPEELAHTLTGLALLAFSQDRLAEAEERFREVLELQRSSLGPTHPDIAQTVNNMGLLYQRMGRHAEAEPLLRESIRLREALLGEAHPRVAIGIHNLALLLFERGSLVEAEERFRTALARMQATLGTDHPQVATAKNNLADVLTTRDELAEARQFHGEALDARMTVLGPEHPHVAYSLTGLARVHLAQGNLGAADSLHSTALALREAVHGSHHQDVAVSLYGLGEVRAAQNRLTEADSLHRAALSVRRSTLPAGHPLIAESLLALSRVSSESGLADSAIEQAEAGLEITRAVFSEEHWRTAQAKTDAASALLAAGRTAEAKPLLQDAAPLLTEALGSRHPLTRRAQALLVRTDSLP